MQRHRSHPFPAIGAGPRSLQSAALAACRRDDDSRLAVCTFEISGEASEVKLFPAGEFAARDGRGPWRMDADIAARVIERARERNTDIVIDYEHQTLNAPINGQPAPAAGWFNGDGLEWRDGDGLYATNVRWTERARSMISAGEYRYVSPVFLFIPETGEVLEILHVGVTNDPALDALPALAEQAAARMTQYQPEEGTTVDQLKQLLGLAQEATEAQVQQALAALKSNLAETLGLEQNATADEIQDKLAALKSKADAAEGQEQALAALKRGENPDPGRFVPLDQVHELRNEVSSLRAEQTQREVEELVQAGLSDGRILPAQESWARDLGGKDLQALKSYLETAEPIAALRGSQSGGQTPAGGGNAAGELTESQLAICTAMGIDPETYRRQLGIGGDAGGGNQ